jgi:membrane fusion protein, multidrug efflux system
MKFMTGSGLLLMAVALGLAGCGSGSAPARPAAEAPLQAVTVATVALSTEALPVEVSGVASRKLETALAFKTGGVVAEVLVRAGDAVKESQPLARLKLDEVEAAVSEARAALEKTKRDLARADQLLAERVITREQQQNAATLVEQAAAAVRAAEFNARQSRIVAPTAGRVLRRLAEPEQMVGAGTPILSLASETDGWLVRVGLADEHVLRVRVGDPVEVHAPASGETLRGTVTQIAEGSDPITRTTEAEITLAEPIADRLKSGFVVHARILPRPVAPRPVVPAAALVEGGGDRAVESGRVRRLPVEVEVVADERVFLRTALPAGAQVVSAGAEFLREGQAVDVRPAVR